MSLLRCVDRLTAFAEPILPHFAFDLRHRLAQDRILRAQDGDTYETETEDDHKPDLANLPPSSPTTAEPTTWAHLKSKERKKRLKRRDLRAKDPNPVKRVARKRRSEALPVYTNLDTPAIPVASSGWISTARSGPSGFGHTLAYLIGILGMRLIDWDGRTPRPLLDAAGRIIGVLAGRPRGRSYDQLIASAEEEMRRAGPQFWAPGKKKNRRGNFSSAVTGISFGGGQKKPSNLRTSATNTPILRHLCDNVFRRIAQFGNSMFLCYAPKIHRFYQTNLEALLQHDPSLHRNFPGSVFTACTYNFGPATVTKPHLDRANLAWGWCVITALGLFNPDLGGHLILWDLGLVIQFPPGSTILIPSAILTHSNVPIADGEERFSFTQYAAGHLFRWVDNDFKTDKDFMAKATPEQLRRREELRSSRWAEGVSMFSTLAEL